MNIKRNIIFALENRKKDGIPITQNVPIRMRVVLQANGLSLQQAIGLIWRNGMQTSNG